MSVSLAENQIKQENILKYANGYFPIVLFVLEYLLIAFADFTNAFTTRLTINLLAVSQVLSFVNYPGCVGECRENSTLLPTVPWKNFDIRWL